MHICRRQTFWKEKKYKTVEKGKNWTIERIVESGSGWGINRSGSEQKNVSDLNEMLRKALRKKRYKWE